MFRRFIYCIIDLLGLNKEQKSFESDIRFSNIREAMRGFGSDK